MANKKPKDLEKKPTSWKFFFPRTFRKVKEPDSPNLQCPTRFEREKREQNTALVAKPSEYLHFF